MSPLAELFFLENDLILGPADPATQASQAYGLAVAAVKKLIRGAQPAELSTGEGLLEAVGRLRALLIDDNQNVLALSLRATPENYLYGHCVNAAILSLRLGVALGWDEERLLRLGLAALLHDVGLMPWLKTVLEPRRLAPQELEGIRLREIESQRLLKSLRGIDPADRGAVSRIIEEDSARREGRPGSHGEAPSRYIQECAQIIGLCDAYESLSHPRSWREPRTPHEAVKAILKLPSGSFDPALVKLFATQMGLYPPGSLVQLRDGEIGRVCRVHPESPTRPVVEFFIDASGERLRLPWYADLKEQPLLHIESAVDPARLEIEDDRLRVLFEAGRWWL